MTRLELVKAQQDFCKAKGFPMFLPLSGVCYRCGCIIANHLEDAYASEHLITACPVCNCSFCD